MKKSNKRKTHVPYCVNTIPRCLAIKMFFHVNTKQWCSSYFLWFYSILLQWRQHGKTNGLKFTLNCPTIIWKIKQLNNFVSFLFSSKSTSLLLIECWHITCVCLFLFLFPNANPTSQLLTDSTNWCCNFKIHKQIATLYLVGIQCYDSIISKNWC